MNRVVKVWFSLCTPSQNMTQNDKKWWLIAWTFSLKWARSCVNFAASMFGSVMWSLAVDLTDKPLSSRGLGVSCPAAIGSGFCAVYLPVLSLTFTSHNTSTSLWLQPWSREKLMDIWMGCNNNVSSGTGGIAMRSVDLTVNCYRTVLLNLLLALLVVDAPFLKLCKAKMHGALGWLDAWSGGQQPCSRQGFGTRWSLKSLPVQAILWFFRWSTPSLLSTAEAGTISLMLCSRAPWCSTSSMPRGFGVCNLNPQSYTDLWLLTNLQTCAALLHFYVL